MPAENADKNRLDDLIAARLIGQYQSGNLEAFVLLHHRYRARVLGMARARLDSEDDAEDVTQQVFVKVLQALRAYDPAERSFRRWLLTVTKNTAEDHGRRTRRSEPAAPDILDRWLDDLQDITPAWGEDSDVHGVLAELSEADQQVLVLVYRWDLSPRETGIALGRSEASVYKAHARALAKLRARVQPA